MSECSGMVAHRMCSDRFTGGYDFGEDLDEDERLDANPEERRKELFLALVSQADHEEAEAFLRGDDDAGNGVPLDVNVVGEGGLTALHVAAFNDESVPLL